MPEDFTGVLGIVFQRGKPNKYILIHNQRSGNITFPAGGRESYETSSRQTLEREIREETGLLPSEYKLTKTPFVHEFVYDSNKKERAGQKSKQVVYLVETKKTELKPEDPNAKIHGWHTAEEVMEKLTFDDSKELFRKAIKHI